MAQATSTTERSSASWRIEIECAPDVAEITALEHNVDADLVRRAGDDDTQQFAVVARNGRQQAFAGLHASTWGGCCELLTLWVDEGVRRQGIASSLLIAAEQEAARRGCRQVVLFTHSGGPPQLYLRHGYDVVGMVTDYPRGMSAYWLRKFLGTT